MMLVRLLDHMQGDSAEHMVISLTDAHPLGLQLKDIGVHVDSVGATKFPTPRDIARLVRLFRCWRPDVVQTWMLHSNVVGGVAARLAGRYPVAWGIHTGRLTVARHGLRTVLVQRIESRLSHIVPSNVITCSESARREVANIGYAEGKCAVIPNGFDLTAFRPNGDARILLRQELGVAKDQILVGAVSRFHPDKDHRTLLEAAAHVAARDETVHFVLCGPGLDARNPRLMAWARPLGDRVHFLGERDDIPAVTAALDLAVSSSVNEGLPLVIGEAMACEVPVVATDSGDSATVIGETGRIVPPEDARALADAMFEVIRMGDAERRQHGIAARKRIREQYELASTAVRYRRIWESLAAQSTELEEV